MVLLEKFLHFVDNEELADSYNKATKIQLILANLVESLKLPCQLESDISNNNSLLQWKGHLSWKKHIPKKRSRFRLKAFVLSEGSTGYVWNVILYADGDTRINENID